ncbi:hypothetical protein [Streptomyces nigrescens]|uniref:hypothetical protein n=1 Tax=Streptomyces nigrescens TaxID=1920 RepID=UPI0036F848B7
MKIARTVAASALGASVILGGVTMASPAQAASSTQCHTTKKSFDLPYRADVDVKATICAKYTGTWGGYRHYQMWLHKISWDGAWWSNADMSLYFSVRGEHGSDWRSSGEVNNVTDEINGSSSGSKTFKTGGYGYGITYVTTKKRDWTADAYAVYNAHDGRGDRTWQLHGTAPVR